MNSSWHNLPTSQQALLGIAGGIVMLMLVIAMIVLLYLDFKNPDKEQRLAVLIQYLGWSVVLLLWWCQEHSWISEPEAVLFFLLFSAICFAVIFDKKRRKTLSELESRLALIEQTIQNPQQPPSKSSGA